MTSWMVAPLAFAAMMTGAFLAMAIARWSPPDFLSDDTRFTMKVTVGLTAAVTSLILGLMTTSMRYSYAGAQEDVQQYAVAILTTDVELRHFGAQACPARQELATYVRLILDETWSGHQTQPHPQFETSSANLLLRLDDAIRALPPGTDDQKMNRNNAIDGMKMLLTHRWRLTTDAESRVPTIFIMVVMGWLTLIFAGFGWFAPRNPPGLAALAFCGLSIAAALFLVVEMGEPFSGPMRIAPTPLLDALHAIRTHPCEGPNAPHATGN
ncbi:bestrophin-like domain [Xanthobacter agilis]|uniref:bestrophin-like domain n=1 Tax=Xanthobacter agilis TaxID=47492 RepID=UPI0037298DB6